MLFRTFKSNHHFPNLLICFLSFIVKRLVAEGHSIEDAALAQKDFLSFVSLRWLTNEPLVPSKHADDFWHEFIIHTEKYANRCKKYFNMFLHHYPSDVSGDAWERTVSMVNQVYSEDWVERKNAKCSCSCKCKM